MKTDENNYLKDRTVCKICSNYNKKENNKNTLIQKQQPKIEIDNNTNTNRTLIITFSKCGKGNLLNYILLQKQKPISIITKSLNHYPNLAQTPD